MTDVKRPTKAKLREYLYKRRESKEPPPSPEQARRELGWEMLPQNTNSRSGK